MKFAITGNRLLGKLKRLSDSVKAFGQEAFRLDSLVFFPSVFFLVLGVGFLIAPRFLMVLIAAFFLFLGAISFVVAWKLIEFQRKIRSMAKNFEGKISVQGFKLRDYLERDSKDEETEGTERKIIFH